MLNQVSFLECMQSALGAKGFGKKRIQEITDQLEERTRYYSESGKSADMAATLAQRDVFDFMSREQFERIKRSAAMLSVQASNIGRIQAGVNAPVSKFLMDGKRGSRGTAIARAAVSTLEHDPRFTGLDYQTRKENVRGALYALFDATLGEVGKGFMGRQKGKAHLPNIVREIKGEATGDALAKQVADAWLKVSDTTVDMMNAAGGSMNRLANYLPQAQSAVRMVKDGGENGAIWKKDMLDWLDWERTRWPDGSIIKPEERADLLDRVWLTLTTDGANKIDVTAFRGRGRAVGNMLDDHRFLHFNGENWLKMHAKYSDGNIMDTLFGHIEHMSHKIAMVEQFGPNPEMTANNIKSIVRAEAAKHGAKAMNDAEAVLKNKFDPMFETANRMNAMDPHSVTGAMVTGASNVLTSAMLGSASFLAIPGDFMQTAAVRALNNQGLFGGIGTYVKALATDMQAQKQIATQSGFIMDEIVMSTYAASRWTGMATVGPQLTRRLSEATMRLSLMSGHTRAARWAVQSEFMGMMFRDRGREFGELPYAAMMQRYGITADDWNALRALRPWEPKAGVQFLRPIDAIHQNVGNGAALYRKFQGMIHAESRTAVPEATLEAGVALRGTMRPDTLIGALVQSFSMYKNFPMSFVMIYGRSGMMKQTAMGRLGWYAALGAGMTLVGALGTQMREISRGRDPLPMDNVGFMGKAFLSGGALSIWGDFLFSGVNAYGQGPQDVAAGPLVSFLGDSTSLVLGDTFAFADSVGGLSDKEFKSNTGAKAVEFARRYTPGASIWWARAALERQVFDRLQDLADPQAARKRQKQMRKRKREYGNEYWWTPGHSAPSRAPEYRR